MSNESQNPTTAPNPWRETVRAIFDHLHFGRWTVFNDDCAREIVATIEERHHDYFCVGKTMAQWKKEIDDAKP